MVEPEMAEKMVPATTATTARRPGTCAIRRSTPSITLTAMPVWNSTSPIRMKSGIGVREKLAMEITLFRASCCTPTSPPSQITAPAMFTAMKVKATGRPASRSTVDPPSISHAANSHDISSRRHGVFARPALAVGKATHAEEHLDRKQREGDRQRHEQPPLGRNHRLHRHGARAEARVRHLGAVPDHGEAAEKPHHVGEPLAIPCRALGDRAQDDVDADVLALPQ